MEYRRGRSFVPAGGHSTGSSISMRRALTFLLILCTLAFWSASLWTLSARVSGTDFLWCSAPAAFGLLMLIGLFVSGRIFNPVDRVRRLFSAVLATTLLIVIACVYADVLVLNGAVFEKLLGLFNLGIFIDSRLILTLACAGALVHPVLFVIAGVGLLCLPPPSDNFFRQ